MSFLKQLFATRKNPYKPWENQRDTVEIDLSGTRLSMELPPHSNIEGFTREPAPTTVNVYDDSAYQSDAESQGWQREGIAIRHLCSRDWDFRGPQWEQWPYGKVIFAASLARYDALPEDMSCFNPAHFENVVLRRAYYRGPGQPDFAKQTAPNNWQLFSFDGNTAIYYEFHPDLSDPSIMQDPFDKACTTSCLYIPVGTRHFLQLNFKFMGYAPADESLENMNTVRDEVLSAVHCLLSDAQSKDLQQARSQWPNAKARTSFNPQPWIYPEWRRGENENEPEIVRVTTGSPPPTLSL